MKNVLMAGGFAASVWDLITQVPTNALLIIGFLVCFLMLVVLFHEPACSRLIRIIKAFTEVRQPKEH